MWFSIGADEVALCEHACVHAPISVHTCKQRSAEVWKRARLSASLEEVRCDLLLGKVWRRTGACQKTFSPELVNSSCVSSCFTALNTQSWISLASVGHRRWWWCVWVLLDCTVCACCLRSGMRVFSYSYMPTRMSRSSCSPKWVMAELQEHWLQNVWVSSLSFVSLCRKWQHDKAEIVGCGKKKKKDMWLASIEILWHMRQNNRPMLSLPHAKKMNYRHYWRCFPMPNCQLPMRNTYWCINPARCSKCHFTTHWARTSFK